MRTCKAKKIISTVLASILLCTSIYSNYGISNYIKLQYKNVTIAYAATTGSVTSSSLNIRSGPTAASSKIGVLGRGATVNIIAEVIGPDNKKWYRINHNKSGRVIDGYVVSTYIKLGKNKSYNYDASFEQKLNNEGFPESYKIGLRQIHVLYPNWEFKAFKTGLDWNEVIKNESIVGRNLVAKTSKSSWKSIETGAYDWNSGTWVGFDSSYWVGASTEIIRYYMDPRNFLDSTYIFQFLDQKYNSSIHNIDGVRAMIKNTYLDSYIEEGDAPFLASIEKNNKLRFARGNDAGSYFITENGVNDIKLGAEPILTQDLRRILVSPSGEFTGENIYNLIFKSKSPASKNNTIVSGSVKGPNASGAISSDNSSSNAGPGAMLGSNYDSNINNIGPGGANTINNAAANTIINGTKSYADIIMKAAAVSGINPYVLTAMLIQEQGIKGSSGLISGHTAPYNGIYNYFNIGAYQEGSKTATMRGLEWASINGSYGRPWNSREKAIVGGAVFYGENYVNAGQNTFYLKKYNVQGQNIYKHQYMTNVAGAADEGARFAKAYDENLKQQHTIFSIPIYNNMPEVPAAIPALDGSPNNKLGGLSVDGYNLTPVFNRDTEVYNIIVPRDVASVNINASPLDQRARVVGSGNIALGDNGVQAEIAVVAQNGNIRRYYINIIKQGSSISQIDTRNIANINNTENKNTSKNIGPTSNMSNNTDFSNYGPGVVNNKNNNESAVSLLGPSN